MRCTEVVEGLTGALRRVCLSHVTSPPTMRSMPFADPHQQRARSSIPAVTPVLRAWRTSST